MVLHARRFSATAVLLTLYACNPGHSGEAGQALTGSALRVSLYQWIPDAADDDFAALRTRVETEFESRNGVDLEVSLSRDPDMPEYDVTKLHDWLFGDGQYDVVEVDAILLGDLAAQGVIKPWRPYPEDVDFHAAGVQASMIGADMYGVPHWLCGHFVLSRDPDILAATNLEDLINALSPGRTPAIPNVTARLAGSWNLPALYLDAWADSHGPSGLENAMKLPLDEGIVYGLKRLARECRVDSVNPCLAGQMFDDFPDYAAVQFAYGLSDATLGYSERLHIVLRYADDPQAIDLRSAPLAEGSQPITFADVFVVRAGCDGACLEAARAFVQYMIEPETFAWILLAEDHVGEDGRVPRYLIPATLSAFDAPGVAENRYFQTIRSEIDNATSYPNDGFVTRRTAVRDSIEADLKR